MSNIFARLAAFIKKILHLDDPARAELKHVYAVIANIKPPYYRFKNNLVLPGFANDLFMFCSALKPLMGVADRTIAHPDLRVSRKFFDYLIDCRLPPEDLDRKAAFSYDGMKARIENAIKSDEEIDTINHEFQQFLRHVDTLMSSSVNLTLDEVHRLAEICRHDWERTLGFFDPGISLEDSRYIPDPQPCEGEQALPEIVDTWFLTANFTFSESLLENFILILAKHAPESVQSQTPKITKIFNTLNKVLKYRLSQENLLALARLSKHSPSFTPNLKHDRVNYLDEYRNRILSQFEKDRDRLLRERHENAVAKDIRELLGTTETFPMEEYDEINDAYLRKETPTGFTHIKALGILKTFFFGLFDQGIKESIKKILVEGYFDNKSYQNNLANILFQCDRTGSRITGFEKSLRNDNRISMGAVKRYVDEMRHGKDILVFLNRIVDEINFNAREICEDETGLFQMLSDATGELLADYKKSAPQLVTNIRTLGGLRNREIMGAIMESKQKLDMFIRIMRNFSIIKVSATPIAPPAVTAPSSENGKT